MKMNLYHDILINHLKKSDKNNNFDWIPLFRQQIMIDYRNKNNVSLDVARTEEFHIWLNECFDRLDQENIDFILKIYKNSNKYVDEYDNYHVDRFSKALSIYIKSRFHNHLLKLKSKILGYILIREKENKYTSIFGRYSKQEKISAAQKLLQYLEIKETRNGCYFTKHEISCIRDGRLGKICREFVKKNNIFKNVRDLLDNENHKYIILSNNIDLKYDNKINTIEGYKFIKTLGIGKDGKAFLVKDSQSNKLVLKIYHEEKNIDTECANFNRFYRDEPNIKAYIKKLTFQLTDIFDKQEIIIRAYKKALIMPFFGFFSVGEYMNKIDNDEEINYLLEEVRKIRNLYGPKQLSRRSFIHEDLTEDNIIIENTKSGFKLRVIDFLDIVDSPIKIS